MLTNRPALKFCLPFLAGIIVGWHISLPALYVGGAVAILFLFSFVYNIFDKSQDSFIGATVLITLIFLFGTFKIILDAKVKKDNNVSHLLSSTESVVLHGVIADDPKKSSKSIQFIIDPDIIDLNGRRKNVEGGTAVSFRYQDIDSLLIDSLVYGREIVLSGKLAAVGGARNPGEFDLQEYYRINNIHAKFIIDRFTQVRLGSVKSNFLSQFVFPIRHSIAHHLQQFIGGKEAAFLKGLTVGDRSEIDPEVKDAFINAGVMHILAVSGLHVGMIILILFSVLTALRIPKVLRTVSLCAFLIVYIFLTGSSPSVVRAVIMAIVLLLGTMWEQKTDVYNSIAVAAIILLLIDAKNLFQAGFQLSFVAVISIVYLYPKISKVCNTIPEKIREYQFSKPIISLISVSFAAAIGTLPFTSLYFGKISIIGLAANLVIVPMSGIVLALGITTVTISYLSVGLAQFYAETTKLLTFILLRCVSYFGTLSISHIDAHFTLLDSILFYALVIFIVNIQNKKFAKRSTIVFLFIGNIFLIKSILIHADDQILRITFLDVGQGDSAYLEFPDGKNMLIDAGPWTYNTDAGSRFVVPFIKNRGVNHINTVIISHPHSDHFGGIPSVLRNISVDEIYDAGSFPTSSLSIEIKKLTDSLHIPYQAMKAGMVIQGLDNFRLYVLHPSGNFVPKDSGYNVNFNNQSLVLKLLYGQTSLLFSGDAEEPAEHQIAGTYGNFLASNVLKAGHHGSITSSSTEYLQYIQPATAIISVGQYNKFGHPSQTILDRYTQMKCSYYRTDERGAVILESNGQKWTVVDWR